MEKTNEKTKVLFTYNKDGSLLFDCYNHAGDHDVCTIVSTLCNVLVEACVRFDLNFEPTIYNKGHVRIDLSMTNDEIREIFHVVEGVMHQAMHQHPEHIYIY